MVFQFFTFHYIESSLYKIDLVKAPVAYHYLQNITQDGIAA